MKFIQKKDKKHNYHKYFWGLGLLFCGTALLYTNLVINSSNNSANRTTKNNSNIVSMNTNQTTHKKDTQISSFEGYYYPEYKDNNNICGLAKNNDTGDIVAIQSTSSCPTQSLIYQNNNLNYILTVDTYRPEIQNDSCGLAHIVQDSDLLSNKDLNKLQSEIGDLNNLTVSTYHNSCPTIAELSDIVKSPVGVPVHFMYNDINLNKDNYPIMTWDLNSEITNNSITDVGSLSSEEVSLLDDYALYKDYHDANGDKIPMVFVNQTSKQICGNILDQCSYNKDKLTLTNKYSADKVYSLTSSNGFSIPADMVVRKSYDVCQGDYSQCDLITDDNGNNVLLNINTNETYVSQRNVSVSQF